MEFQRIGKNTVQCHMSVEEMQEYGFAIEDFFTDQEKSREFLEQLVERAEEEVGYEVESGMVSMQLMKMPDESLVITFSDRSEEGIQGMMEQLHNLTEMIGRWRTDSGRYGKSGCSKKGDCCCKRKSRRYDGYHTRCRTRKGE